MRGGRGREKREERRKGRKGGGNEVRHEEDKVER